MSRKPASATALAPLAASSSPEMRLLLAAIDCALKGRGQDGRALPSAQDTRWVFFLTLALDHHVGGVALVGLSRLPDLVVPPLICAQLTRHADEILKQRADGIAELGRIVRALGDAGIEVIPIKGPMLRQRLFGEIAAGPSRDLDLLIRPHVVTRAFDILARSGYRGEVGFSRRQYQALLELKGQDLLRREDGRFVIEPHIGIMPSNLGTRIDHEAMWGRSRQGELDGVPIRVLEPEDEFLLLAVHGSKEGWARLKWLADLAALVARGPRIDWDTVARRAEMQRVRRMLGLSALLLAEIFSFEVPAAALARRDPRLCAIAERIIVSWDHPSDAGIFSPSSVFEFSWTRSLLCDGIAARVSYLLRTVLTPREIHYRLVKFPDWMFPAYYLVKLTHDYLLWPIWIMLKRSGALSHLRMWSRTKS